MGGSAEAAVARRNADARHQIQNPRHTVQCRWNGSDFYFGRLSGAAESSPFEICDRLPLLLSYLNHDICIPFADLSDFTH